MRLLATSDWHADWSTLGVSRFAEVERAAWRTVEEASNQRVDLYVFTGDLADPDVNPYVVPRAQHLAISIAIALRSIGVMSAWVAGNHDVCEDGSGASTLRPIKALEAMNNVVTPHVRVFEEPGVMAVERCKEGLLLLALPFTAPSHAYDPADFVRACHAPGVLNVVAGHLAVEGIQPGEEVTEMPRGREVTFPLDELAKVRAEGKRLVLMNGHYHEQQHFETRAGHVHVAGSLARLTFSAERHRPGFLILEV